jgi:hypothetical protein
MEPLARTVALEPTPIAAFDTTTSRRRSGASHRRISDSRRPMAKPPRPPSPT